MKILTIAAVAVIVLLVASQARAGTQEDLAFAEGLLKRRWYDWAAGVFDRLRHEVACTKGTLAKPEKGCRYTTQLKPEDYDKPAVKCPKCGEGRMEKVHDYNLQIQEGAAKSYLRLYETDNKNKEALDKAQDIYQRIYGWRDGDAPGKKWEIAYIILKVWYYKGDYKRVVAEVKNLLFFYAQDLDNPAEQDLWEKAFPVQPWRDKIREIYIKACQALKEEEPVKELKKELGKCEDALKAAEADKNADAEVSARMLLAKCLTDRLWKDEEAKENAKKALETLEPFKDRFADNEEAKKLMSQVLACVVTAHRRLEQYDKVHSVFLELEKKHPKSRSHIDTAWELFEAMRNRSRQQEDLGKEKEAKASFEKAGYYVMSWYNSSKEVLTGERLLGAGVALCEGGKYKTASDELTRYLRNLPKPEARSKEQETNATTAKIFLAESRYGMGEYRDAALLFDLLRHVVACTKGTPTKPEKGCGYMDRLDPKNFDKEPKECPKCGEGRMEKLHDASLAIHEGAAKSYLAMYDKKGMRDVEALDKAQDIYQRIYGRLSKMPELDKPGKTKLYEVLYNVLLIWYYKKDYKRIVGEREILDVPPPEPIWESCRTEPWRTKLKEIYEKALKELEKKESG